MREGGRASQQCSLLCGNASCIASSPWCGKGSDCRFVCTITRPCRGSTPLQRPTFIPEALRPAYSCGHHHQCGLLVVAGSKVTLVIRRYCPLSPPSPSPSRQLVTFFHSRMDVAGVRCNPATGMLPPLSVIRRRCFSAGRMLCSVQL